MLSISVVESACLLSVWLFVSGASSVYEGVISDDKARTRLTYTEDLKYRIQHRSPSPNLALDIVRSKVFNHLIPLGLFIHLPLYFLDCPVINTTVGGRSQSVYHWIDPPLQPVYRIAYRLAELLFPPFARSLPKHITGIGTKYSKIHTFLVIGHFVLTTFKPRPFRSQREMRLTLIVVRRVVATPKTAGAGVMAEASVPIFTRRMAPSSERITPPRFVGCLDLSVMVETQGDRGVAIPDKGCAEDSER